MLRSPGVDDHTVDSAGLLDDPVHGFGRAVFFRDVGLDGVKLARVTFLDYQEVVSRRTNVDAVDLGGAVVEAGVGDSETDTCRIYMLVGLDGPSR